MNSFKDTIIISLGGSLLIPDQVDVSFIGNLKEMVTSLCNDNYQIVLVIGGGNTSRQYCKAASHFDHISNEDLDWIGIKTIHLNAELILRIFSNLDIHKSVVMRTEEVADVKESVVIVGAWQPGHSSDFNTVTMAKEFDASTIVNFSNITYIYDKDPATFRDAKKISKCSWLDYRKLIPKKWSANLSSPFDPVASAEAEKNGLKVVVVGASLENLNNFLHNKEFEGTIIE